MAQTIKSTELVKGQRIELQDGWRGTLAGKPGNKKTVLATIEGVVTETGSIYVHDIYSAQNNEGEWLQVELTPGQTQTKNAVRTFGF